MKLTMGKPKCLPAMCCSMDTIAPAPVSTSDVPNSVADHSNQDLSLSFRVYNELATNGSDMRGSGTEEEHKKATAKKDKRKTRIRRNFSSINGTNGVLLKLHVPVPLRTPPHVAQEKAPFTIEELKEREMKFSKNGCWPAFLG
ncbi:uncharacterized protein LOC144576102 [Carex rostrata]